MASVLFNFMGMGLPLYYYEYIIMCKVLPGYITVLVHGVFSVILTWHYIKVRCNPFLIFHLSEKLKDMAGRHLIDSKSFQPSMT